MDFHGIVDRRVQVFQQASRLSRNIQQSFRISHKLAAKLQNSRKLAAKCNRNPAWGNSFTT
jgi:hypothetical protein